MIAWSKRPLRALSVAILLAAGVHGVASAEDDSARALLKRMSDYLVAQKDISFKFDSVLEIVTSDLQKVQFTSSGTARISRPDRFRVTRTGGFTDAELISDGKTLTIFGKKANAYAQLPAPASIDEMVDELRSGDNIQLPGADLVLSNVYDQLIGPVTDAKDIGPGIVGGIECQHLAFRTPAVDWEIWVRLGEHPIPCRYVIHSKLVSQSPEYMTQIRDWQTGADATADDFAFTDGGTAEKIDVAKLQGIDELPGYAAGDLK